VLDAVTHRLVREHIELLLQLALDVESLELTQDIGEAQRAALAAR